MKIKGNKVPWHSHENEDELFYIVEGSLLFEIKNEDSFTMNTGDLFIIKKGISHKISSQKECKVMLIEHKETTHTGTAEEDITKSIQQQLC